jgi:hypothetical protein
MGVTKLPDVTLQCLRIWNMLETSGKVRTWAIMPVKQMITLDGHAGAVSTVLSHWESLLRNYGIWGPLPRSQPPNKEVWMRSISEMEIFRPFRVQAISSRVLQCQVYLHQEWKWESSLWHPMDRGTSVRGCTGISLFFHHVHFRSRDKLSLHGYRAGTQHSERETEDSHPYISNLWNTSFVLGHTESFRFVYIQSRMMEKSKHTSS